MRLQKKSNKLQRNINVKIVNRNILILKFWGEKYWWIMVTWKFEM